ncbi:MAG: LacI family transcriptional regulator [Spirochaetes bacterium]|nr:LacI family transcriptional regulator [Spirochaetota bacterium]
MITMDEVAEKAGVSQATVSRVVNGSPTVSQATKQKVMEWIRKLNYQPNLTAQSLVRNQSYLIGVVIPNITNPFFSELLQVVELEAYLNGYNIIFCNNDGNVFKEKKDIAALQSRRIDGLLIVPIKPTEKHIQSLKKSDFPVVMLTRYLEGFDSVTVSHEKGGELIGQHFCNLGFTKIALIGTKDDRKFTGFNRVLQKNKIEFNDDHLIECSAYDEFSSHTVHQNLKTFFQNRKKGSIEAIFALNDISAFVATRVLQDHGFTIPDDIAVAGFDNTFLAIESRPPITSVAQPIQEIGKLSVELLLNRIAQRGDELTHLLLEPRLIIRESTMKITSRS